MMDHTGEAPLISALDARGVLTLTMNRPQVHNAFDDHQAQRMTEALEQGARDDAVRIVVLAASGKTFCAGGDLNYMRRMGDNTYQENLADASRLARLMRTLNQLPKPTIARVQGGAFGGAVGLVSCCDIAIGSTRAKFALSEARVGMAPATIAPYVVRAIGERAARRYFTTAQTLHADRALALGLLSEVVGDDELDKTVEGAIRALLDNGPAAIGKAKQIVLDVVDREITDELVDHTVRFIADIRHSDEGREGLSAFLEKREPRWRAGNS